MKSRSIIRALCVGASLLVPASGLTVLNIGTAGASGTSINFSAPSTVRLGTIGTATLKTVSVSITSGTHQGNLTKQVPIETLGVKLLVMAKVAVTPNLTGPTSILFKTLRTLLKTTGFTHCLIVLPNIDFTKTGSHFVATGVALSGVSIITTGGTCGKKATMVNDFTHKLSGKLTETIT